MNKSLVILAIIYLVSSQTPHHDPVAHSPLVYKVNLEDPPMVRWAPIIKDFE